MKGKGIQKRSIMWAGVLLTCLLAVIGGLRSVTVNHTVSFTERELQAYVSNALPKKFVPSGVARVVVKNLTAKTATVNLEGKDLVVTAEITGTLLKGNGFSFMTRIIGLPRFFDGKFYLAPKQVEVKNFAYLEAPPVDKFMEFAKKYIQDPELIAIMEDATPRVEGWLIEAAQDSALHILESRPMYKVPDNLGGNIVSSSLDSIEIANKRLILTFELWRLTFWPVVSLLVIALALHVMVKLSKNPEVGRGLTPLKVWPFG